MSDRIKPGMHEALAGEIRHWQEQQLISSEQADKLIALYPPVDYRSHVVTVVTIIGAVLVGLGGLLYISANWHNIGTLSKLLILITAVVGCHFAAWRLKYGGGSHPRLGVSFLLLGSLLFGASIWLIAQMFNTSLDPSSGLFTWFIGVAASALVTRSAAVGILSSVILGMWMVYPDHWWWWRNFNSHNGYEFLFGTIAGIEMSRQLRSKAMLWVNTLAATMWVLVCSQTGHGGLYMWGVMLFGAYLLCKKYWHPMQAPLKYVGLVVALSAMLVATFKDAKVPPDMLYVNFAGLVCAAVVTLLAVMIKVKEYRNEALGALLMVLYFIFFQDYKGELTRIVAFNVAVVLSLVGLSISGLKSLKSIGVLNVAIVFVVIDIICRYFDIFFSMMDRSLFFMVGGVVLMTAGALAEKGRRHLVGGAASE
ncbi:MAG: DUF2157 domain-containing protein [Candidatus Obscuribacter sp.]|nr:DUF2157 domain-containing protein [Candidatus Obscuribacter sp.]MBP6350613.1 DUF2157 domain-containing protein [Candidatus Obscuribacter sp.]MBP6593038.1 DUF2157 domain-containing protein [Candidatus Obscuribacter sp.]